MEVFGAGARVVTFLALGIQSARTIHEILSLVKDGTRIDRIRQDFQGLQVTLDRLSRSHAVAEIRDDALATKIKACANDMETFAEKLKRLTPDGAEPRLSRHWKSFKALMNEKDLIDMGDVIVKHTTALSLYLKVLESDTLYEVQNKLATIKQDVSVYQTGQATIIAQQTSMSSTLGAIKDETQTGQATIIAQQTSLSYTLGAIKDETQTIQESIRAAQLQSDVQVNQFMRMFTELTEQLSALSLAHGIGATVVEEVPGPGSTQPTAETLSEEILPFHEILEGIQSILAAAQDKEGVFAYNDAKEIADALIALLQTVISDQFLDSVPRFTAAYRSWCETCTKGDLADLRQNLRAVQGTLISSRKVSVNVPTSGKREHPTGIVDRNLWKRRSYDIGFGVVSFASAERAWKVWPVDSQSTPEALKSSTDDVEETEMRISFVPRLDLTQKLDGFQTVIRQSHCYDEMLKLGTTSLRDHDERGASLLFGVTDLEHDPNSVPITMIYTIQYFANINLHGADVDQYSSSLADSVGAQFATTALFVGVNDDEAEEEQLKRIQECQKLLLEAGCDPTLPHWNLTDNEYESGGADEDAFLFAVPVRTTAPILSRRILGSDSKLQQELMRIFLDNSALVTIESIVHPALHLTPLLSFCSSYRRSVEGLSILLSRGANIHARDKFGSTCLDLCVSTLEGTSGPGDLCDVVLADCGFDVAWFRLKFGIRRRAEYGHGYTRQVFEDLWKGQEHLCPYYYDDEEAPATDEDSAGRSTTDEELDDTNDDGSSDYSETEGGAYLKDKGDDI
ncbi:hypothetical protein V8F06_011227 [Rhypophila decipiens]